MIIGQNRKIHALEETFPCRLEEFVHTINSELVWTFWLEGSKLFFFVFIFLVVWQNHSYLFLVKGHISHNHSYLFLVFLNNFFFMTNMQNFIWSLLRLSASPWLRGLKPYLEKLLKSQQCITNTWYISRIPKHALLHEKNESIHTRNV